VGNVYQTGTVVLPAGEEVDQGTTGSWSAPFASKIALVGSSTGAVLTGNPLVMQGVAVVQLNPAGASVSGSSTSGDPTKTIVLRECVLAGAGKSGTFSNYQAPITMENCQVTSVAGFEFGGVASLARFVGCVGSSMGTGARMFSVLAGATVAGGMQWTACTMITGDPTDRMIYIDPSATVPGNATGVTTDIGMRASGNQITSLTTANLGRIFDEAGLDEEDQRVWATNNLYGDESLMWGQCEFLVADLAPVPIPKTYSSPDTFEDIPRDNGGAGLGNEILLDAVSQRFDLETPGLTEWYLRLNGPLPAGRTISWTASIEASSTSSTIKARAEWRQGTGGTWAEVPGSTSLRIQVNNAPGFFAGSGRVPSTLPDSHFKITISNDNAAAATEVLALALFIS
jgi:hypothetical protein